MYITITKNSDGDRINALETRVEALEAATGATTVVVPETVVPETVIPETGVTPSGVTGTTTPVIPTVPAE